MSENSVLEQEIWTPLPEDWYSAIVESRDLRKRLLILTLTNGEKVSCFSSRISRGVGGHVVCTNVPVGASCAVRLERDNRNHSRYFAIECRFDSDKPIPAKTIERVVIHSWAPEKTFGTAIRPCGDPVFCSTSHRNGSFATLKEGDVVECAILPSNRKKGLAAAYVIGEAA